MNVTTDASALVARTCAAQGLPEKVGDPTVLAAVAALVVPVRDSTPAGPGCCKDQSAGQARGGRLRAG